MYSRSGKPPYVDMEIVPMYWPLAYHVWAAEEIKKVVGIPVMASGSITSPNSLKYLGERRQILSVWEGRC